MRNQAVKSHVGFDTEVMDEPFPVVDADAPLEHISTLLSSSTPAALVRRNGEYLGIVTRYDVLHKVAGIR